MAMNDSILRDALYAASGMESIIEAIPDDSGVDKASLINLTKEKLLAQANAFNDHYRNNMEINNIQVNVTGIASTVTGTAAVTTAPGVAVVTASGTQSAPITANQSNSGTGLVS